MIIEKARYEELDEILSVYDGAREFMHTHGNPTQWPDKSYPGADILEYDIKLGRLYTVKEEKNGPVLGVFVILYGKEPAYGVIEGGKWLSDSEYVTLHRIASSRIKKGIGAEIFAYAMDICKEKGLDLRADTHEDNKPMRHVFEKAGLRYCGIVWMADGTPRMAYQWVNGNR